MMRLVSPERFDPRCNRIASFIAVVMGICAAVSGCSRSERTDKTSQYFQFLDKYNYPESTGMRPLVESVVNDCNLLISPNLAIRLSVAWPKQLQPTPSLSPVLAANIENASTFTAKGGSSMNATRRARSFDSSVVDFLNPTPYPTKISIPVYLVRATDMDNKTISFVPSRDKCIFVNASGLEYVSELFQTDSSSGTQHAGRDAELALTLILLHEVGHIFNGDAGSFVQSSFPDLDEINGSMNDAKSRELKADLFAVDQISGARSSSFPVTRLPLGAEVAAFVGSATFRTGMKRAEAEVGEMYLERDDTHPNFYLRLLIMSYKMYPNPFSSELLTTFLARRERTLNEARDHVVPVRK